MEQEKLRIRSCLKNSVGDIMASDLSILIGGAAGDGINEAGLIVGRLFSQLGYFVYMYYDYPSLIRGDITL